MTPSEQQRKDGLGGNNEQSLRALWALNRRANILAVRVPGGEKKVFKVVVEEPLVSLNLCKLSLLPRGKGKWEKLRNLSGVTQLMMI